MKTKFVLMTILAVAVLFSACVGTRAMGVFDESVPEERQCHLEIRNNLAVILFNNRPVEWAPGLTENRVTISLPPGEHSFMVRYYVSRSYGGISEMVPVTASVAMEFIPGHSYQIYKLDLWLLKIVKIKDVTPKGNT